MPLTRSFRETIQEQLTKDDFRREFLRESVTNMIAGDLETAKSVLREYINGFCGAGRGFVQVAEEPDANAKRPGQSPCAESV